MYDTNTPNSTVPQHRVSIMFYCANSERGRARRSFANSFQVWMFAVCLTYSFTYSTCASLAQEWKPAPGPLATRWAKDVRAASPLPEYPRPQLVRSDWKNLNGLWEYAITEVHAECPDKADGNILVPFAIESSLSGVGKQVGPQKALWYRRTLSDITPMPGSALSCTSELSTGIPKSSSMGSC